MTTLCILLLSALTPPGTDGASRFYARQNMRLTASIIAAAAKPDGPKEWLEKNTTPEEAKEVRSLYGYLLAFLFNTIGFSFFIYGKKQKRYIVFTFGILLMGYPYLITSTLMIGVIGVVLCVAPFALRRFGVDG